MFMQDITRLASNPVPAALSADSAAQSQGIFGPTLLETASGWRPAASLRIGDRLHTLDGGLRRIAALSRRVVVPGERAVMIQGGHFDACDDMLLMPGQGVLLQTLDLMSAPYARLAARTLTGCIGANHALAPRRAEIVTPIFAEDEAIWAQSGVLLLCPDIRGGASAFPEMRPEAARLFLAERLRRFG